MKNGTQNKTSISIRFKNLEVHDRYWVMTSARKGLKPAIFFEFAEASKTSEKTLANILNLSARTINNYAAQKKTLDPVNGEHLLKLISLYDKGEMIFGTLDEFNSWLRKPFWKSKETPLDWISTPGGVDLVHDEIDRLAHGYPV